MPAFFSPLEKRLWLAAAALYGFVALTIYPAPFAINYLRDRNLLRLTVGAILLSALAAGVIWLARTRPGWREWGLLAVAVVVYGLIFRGLDVPQERLHFLEYGALASLVYEALRERRRTRAAAGAPTGATTGAGGAVRYPTLRGPGVPAILLTSAAGWLDEGIQALVPNRYYDLRDVAFNSAAAFLAVLFAHAWRQLRGGDPDRRLPR